MNAPVASSEADESCLGQASRFPVVITV